MNHKALEEFIEIYQTEQCLWEVTCKEYHNRCMKNAAYEKLITKLRETIPGANRDVVVKKINNLRTTFRKEAIKVHASKKSGAGSNDVYVPKLWYFEKLAFLQDQENARESLTNIEEDESQRSWRDDEPVPESSPSPDVNENEVDNEYSVLDISNPPYVSNSPTPTPPSPTNSTSSVAQPRSSKRKCKNDMADTVLTTINEHFKKPRVPVKEDKHDVFGKNVAHKLRGLDNLQRILAEKIINDALFEAELGVLTHNHKIMPVTNTQLPMQHNTFEQPSQRPEQYTHTSFPLPSPSLPLDPLAQAVRVMTEIP